MKPSTKSLLTAAVLLTALVACQKKERPAPLGPAPGTGMPMENAHGAPGGMPMDAAHGAPGGMPARKESTVDIPASVKGKFKSVRVAVVDLATRKETIHVIPAGQDFQVPGTTLVLRFENLIPHFSMGGGVITSKSDQLENPAVQVSILEGGQVAFKGWMFTKFPDAHPVNHPKYGLKLLDLLP